MPAVRHHRYRHPSTSATDLESKTLSRRRNIVLMVIDGLGAKLLRACGPRRPAPASGDASAHAQLTSVFPSTTATAIPTFMTGLAPAQHALTGWHMWLDELQAVTAILPLSPRIGPPFQTPREQLPAQLFDHASLYSGMHRSAWVVLATGDRIQSVQRLPLAGCKTRSPMPISKGC
jgi:predicted AlkP superfamily pyrophosphatase or phosphodiesterase